MRKKLSPVIAAAFFLCFSSMNAIAQQMCSDASTGQTYFPIRTTDKTITSRSNRLMNFAWTGINTCNLTVQIPEVEPTIGYNQFVRNAWFCDSIQLPSNIDATQDATVWVTIGSSDGEDNDSIIVDRLDSNNDFSGDQVVAGGNSIGLVAGQSYSIAIPSALIQFALGQPDMANGLGPVLDVMVHDDSEVGSISLEYCPKVKSSFIYSIKFLCGLAFDEDMSEEARDVVSNGRFYTEVNISNPVHSTAVLQKTVTYLMRYGDQVAREPLQNTASGGAQFSLLPYSSTMDDCAAIGTMTNQSPLAKSDSRLSIGFLTVYSQQQLDIDVVYTTEPFKTEFTTAPQIFVKEVGGRKALIPQ